MYIKELSLNNFRNYEEVVIPFNKNINIITGKNGQGKTNIIEGIYILSRGKSFRTSKDSEMINFEKDYFRVKGDFKKEERNLCVELSLSKKEKLYKINGIEKKKNADLLENVYTVIFSPEDLKTIKDEPEKRRKFIDRQLFQLKPLYYKDLLKYNKILTNRNSTLKEEIIDEGLLDVWDSYLSEFGSKIMIERNELLKKINIVSREINNKITKGKEEFEIKYAPKIELGKDYKEQEKIIKEELIGRRSKDIEMRKTTSGPHLDDIRITIDDKETRKFGSQGQQRTAALSLKLAELKIIKEDTGEDAILLLDDVLSELDNERQQFLIDSFKENQVFITVADINDNILKRFSDNNIYKVSEGKISF